MKSDNIWEQLKYIRNVQSDNILLHVLLSMYNSWPIYSGVIRERDDDFR